MPRISMSSRKSKAGSPRAALQQHKRLANAVHMRLRNFLACIFCISQCLCCLENESEMPSNDMFSFLMIFFEHAEKLARVTMRSLYWMTIYSNPVFSEITENCCREWTIFDWWWAWQGNSGGRRRWVWGAFGFWPLNLCAIELSKASEGKLPPVASLKGSQKSDLTFERFC